MVSQRCILAVKAALAHFHFHYVILDLGEVDILEEISNEDMQQLKKILLQSGLELVDDKRFILIERIKNIIIEMIHFSAEAPIINYSDYISIKLNYDYTYLSNLFSEVKGITIQQYIIINKVEKIKELISYDELNLSEIADKLHYSSAAHLSNQFKKITGLTPSQYKKLKHKNRKPIEELDIAYQNNKTL